MTIVSSFQVTRQQHQKISDWRGRRNPRFVRNSTKTWAPTKTPKTPRRKKFERLSRDVKFSSWRRCSKRKSICPPLRGPTCPSSSTSLSSRLVEFNLTLFHPLDKPLERCCYYSSILVWYQYWLCSGSVGGKVVRVTASYSRGPEFKSTCRQGFVLFVYQRQSVLNQVPQESSVFAIFPITLAVLLEAKQA